MDMQRFLWPGHKKQLLGELQKQQNNAQFCDTLLQTEGISVPIHSCILAALSPHLSQKVSASPSPPSGKKRQLQLQAVKAQTLLKLVGLLYSGELEVKGSVEQNDVLSAARQFGITDLVEGSKNGGTEEGELQKKSLGSCREKEEAGRERNESRKIQDAQVQTEMAGMRNTDSPVEKRSCVSAGTQTVRAGEMTVGSSFTRSDQTEHPTPEPASSVAQSSDISVFLQSQNITLDKYFFSAACPPISSMHRGAQSDGESTLDRSSDSVTTPMSTLALSSNVMTFPISLDDSNSPAPQEDIVSQQSSEFGDSIQMLSQEGTGLEDGKTNGNTADKTENPEQPSHSNRHEMLGEEKGNSREKRRAHVGRKSLVMMKRMQQMMETTQISFKVKLRRRTKGEVWEVVSRQDTDETLSVLTSLNQEGSNHKTPQTNLTNSEPPPSSVQPGTIHNPETLILQPASTNPPEPPSHPKTTSDSQPLSSDCFTPNHNDGLESAPLPQPPGPAEECDEQIEKLLEDIMMGLNILPNLERDCKKSPYHQPNHDRAPALCQVPVTENERPQSQIHAAVSAAGCVYYQDFGTQIGHSSSTDTAQSQPSCSSLSFVQPAAVLILEQEQPQLEQQQEQCSPQYHSSVTCMGQRVGTGLTCTPLSESQICPYPGAPSTISVIPTALYSSGQKLLTTFTYYPACQEPSSQDAQTILEFLPLTDEKEAESSHSLLCMDDMRLPRCLSPLEPSPSAAKHQPTFDNSANQQTSDEVQPQPSLHRRPWLTVNHGSLQFPLSGITHRANKSASLPQDTNRSCGSEQRQKSLELSQQDGRAASCTVKEVEERGAISAGHQNVDEAMFDGRKMEESLKCKQSDSQGDATAPKRRRRKRTSDPQEARSLLAYKRVRVSDGTKGQINLSFCSVSLSSNNVLAKEREMAASSSNMPKKLVGKPNEPSTITESWREKQTGPRDLNTYRTRIRTRGFLKNTRETPSNSRITKSVSKPKAPSAQNVEGVPKRGRGRPRKKKVEEIPSMLPSESSPAVIEKKSHIVKTDPQIDSNLPKEESEQTKIRCEKRRRNGSEGEAIPLKKTINAESTDKPQADNDIITEGRKPKASKWPQMVNLKEFKKLIKLQHSKIRKSKESQDKKTNETPRELKRDGKACGITFEELTKETEITQPQNRDGIKESHVLFNVTIDENCNQIVNKQTAEDGITQQDDTNSSTSKETILFGDESHLVSSFEVVGEEGAKIAAEREQPLKNPDEAQKACDAGLSDTTQQTINDEGSSQSDTHLPEQDKMPADHHLNPQTDERTGPSEAVGFSKSSGCNQEEEEEEEVEVDILHYSPEKMPHSSQCENKVDNMEITEEEEEEEEEDTNEIDVTGDEEE